MSVSVKLVPLNGYHQFGDDDPHFELVSGHVSVEEFNRAVEEDGNGSDPLCVYTNLEHVYGCMVEIEGNEFCILDTEPLPGLEPVTVYYWY